MIKKHTSQFWVGVFDSQKRFSEFVGEDPEYWSEENEDSDNFPLSRFIASQNETWYDHDYMEAGYSEEKSRLKDKFKAYSYSDQWSEAVENKAKSLGINEINAFIMMGINEIPGGDRYLQVSNPCSYKSEGIYLVYVGEFSYTHDYSWMYEKSK